jgi:hypothetical protein
VVSSRSAADGWSVMNSDQPFAANAAHTARPRSPAAPVTSAKRATRSDQRSVALVEAMRDPSPLKRCVSPVIWRVTLSPSSPWNGGGIFDTSGTL